MTDDGRETLGDLCWGLRNAVAYVLNRTAEVDEDGQIDDDARTIVRGFIGQLEDMLTPGGVDRALWEKELEDVDQ